jgi:hypothetical protein
MAPPQLGQLPLVPASAAVMAMRCPHSPLGQTIFMERVGMARRARNLRAPRGGDANKESS